MAKTKAPTTWHEWRDLDAWAASVVLKWVLWQPSDCRQGEWRSVNSSAYPVNDWRPSTDTTQAKLIYDACLKRVVSINTVKTDKGYTLSTGGRVKAAAAAATWELAVLFLAQQIFTCKRKPKKTKRIPLK